MPPKVENIATLIAKRDIAIASLDELYEEFNILYQVQPELRGSVPKNGPIDYASKNHFSLNSADGKGLIPKY